ncbi:zinc finger and SCAN domain-containing protein 32-like [Eublepharis macularius]|uniref:Zinc finger and SCAN domain-containing protein 32-like n=1 Tax=Eublepharis macularius TaxID=481883 RepID=A0AA97J7H6_EUBMA|nr:zinc finger and SCAN domain-containing protein 32-like [Eublepharis macularius]
MKMEGQRKDCAKGEGLQGARSGPDVFRSGSLGEVLQRIPGAQLVKQEPGEGLLPHWEVQWQEFLKTIEPPQSHRETPPFPEEPTPWEDTKAFLASFEQVAGACQWPREEWVAHLLPALSGEAELAFMKLDVRDREDYGKVRAAILQRDVLRRENHRQLFRHFCYKEAEGPRGAYSQLQELCHRWLKVERNTKEQILELLILEQFLSILPPDIQSWVRGHGPETCSLAVALAEDFLQMQQENNRQEQQMLTLLEGAAVNSSKSQEAPSCPGDQPLHWQVKQQVDRSAKLLDDMELNKYEENNNQLEHLELAESMGMLQRRAMENVSRNQAKTSENRKSPKRLYRNHSASKMNSPPPDVLNKTCSELILCSREETHIIPKEGSREDSVLPQHKRVYGHETSFQCAKCGKILSRKDHLIRHQRIHLAEKPHKCSYCGKSFFERSDLIRHERTHTGERPYKCSLCEKSFSHKWLLIKHERTHTG